MKIGWYLLAGFIGLILGGIAVLLTLRKNHKELIQEVREEMKEGFEKRRHWLGTKIAGVPIEPKRQVSADEEQLQDAAKLN